MGTWVCYIWGVKRIYAIGCLEHQVSGIRWTRERRGCLCLSGGQMGEHDPKKGPSMKWSLETCCNTVQYY